MASHSLVIVPADAWWGPGGGVEATGWGQIGGSTYTGQVSVHWARSPEIRKAMKLGTKHERILETLTATPFT